MTELKDLKFKSWHFGRYEAHTDGLVNEAAALLKAALEPRAPAEAKSQVLWRLRQMTQATLHHEMHHEMQMNTSFHASQNFQLGFWVAMDAQAIGAVRTPVVSKGLTHFSISHWRSLRSPSGFQQWKPWILTM